MHDDLYHQTAKRITMTADIVFDRGTDRFNFRAAGVILHENRILLHRVDKNPYFSLPGGRVAFQESSEETIKRELLEELGTDCTIKQPLWVIENFFSSYGKRCHEIAFYFLITLPSTSLLLQSQQFTRDDEGTPLHFAWTPLQSLANVSLYPVFLRTALQQIPDTLQYIVHRDTTQADLAAEL